MPLVSRTREEVFATLAALTPDVRARVSPQWLALLTASAPQDPWIHGFNIVDDAGLAVGLAAFKGPPTDGAIEIAYAVAPEHQSKGYATGAVRSLTKYAFDSGRVRTVRAHTRPDGLASQRVLVKCGFGKAGEDIDPRDGHVWRYELATS